MTIVFFYQYFGTSKGSWSTRVYELTKRWVREGNEVTVVTAPYEKSDIKSNGLITKMEIEGIKIIVIDAEDSNRLSFYRRAVKALQFSIMASWYSLSLPYDIVICSSGPITIGIPGLLSKWIRRKKFIFEVRDLWPAGGIEMGQINKKWQIKLSLWFESVCYKSANLIIPSSPDQEKHILSRFPNLKTLVIPNASDLELFGLKSTESLPVWCDGKIVFTHIGSLGFIHNCGLIIEAANFLKEKGNDRIIIVLIGDGAERDELEKRANNYGLNNIFFTGLRPKNELPVWVQNSYATLFTTLNNPIQNSSSPNKVFDSFAAGTPVIQTTTGWIKELVEEFKCGINVPPDDVESLANAMIMLADNYELRKQLGVNAYEVAKTIFNRDILAKKYYEALSEICTLEK